MLHVGREAGGKLELGLDSQAHHEAIHDDGMVVFVYELASA